MTNSLGRTFLRLLMVVGALLWAVDAGKAQVKLPGPPPGCETGQMRCVTPADRQAAAARAAAIRAQPAPPGNLAAPVPGGTPDYFGIYPNYALSPLLRKFVNPLPGICTSPGQVTPCIPIATKDTTTFPGSDYYQIGLRDYSQQMHADLPATPLRGYYDANPAATDHRIITSAH